MNIVPVFFGKLLSISWPVLALIAGADAQCRRLLNVDDLVLDAIQAMSLLRELDQFNVLVVAFEGTHFSAEKTSMRS